MNIVEYSMLFWNADVLWCSYHVNHGLLCDQRQTVCWPENTASCTPWEMIYIKCERVNLSICFTVFFVSMVHLKHTQERCRPNFHFLNSPFRDVPDVFSLFPVDSIPLNAKRGNQWPKWPVNPTAAEVFSLTLSKLPPRDLLLAHLWRGWRRKQRDGEIPQAVGCVFHFSQRVQFFQTSSAKSRSEMADKSQSHQGVLADVVGVATLWPFPFLGDYGKGDAADRWKGFTAQKSHYPPC